MHVSEIENRTGSKHQHQAFRRVLQKQNMMRTVCVFGFDKNIKTASHIMDDTYHAFVDAEKK